MIFSFISIFFKKMSIIIHKCSNYFRACPVNYNALFSTVYVICKIKNKIYVLIHKRSSVQSSPNLYCGPGGSIDYDKNETSYDAALRELKEETGLNPKYDGYLFFTHQQKRTNNFKAANYVFFSTFNEIKYNLSGPLEDFKNEIDWNCTFDDLEDSIVLPNTGHCLMNIEKNINNPNLSKFFRYNCNYILYNFIK